jgi:SAM-dependent methyltransferase
VSVAERMREDWNRRAREDAYYYVAFGRRAQDDDEFFATAADVARMIESELRRLPPSPPRARRALEVGCGPGRLMRPLSRHFGEIHGVDVSDEMVARARANLESIPHAHAHHAPNSDLAAFADSSFDLVYSYAVFQDIPSREVVFGYLREALRVLKPHGILRFQANGLPQSARTFDAPSGDTWSGVRVAAAELRTFAREVGLSPLAIEGAETQYMWATMRRGPCWRGAEGLAPRIRRATNAHNSEPFAPVDGPHASIALWVEGLPPEADLDRVRVLVNGRDGEVCYLGPCERDGMRQLNAHLPADLGTGLGRVDLLLNGEAFGEAAVIRLIPAGPRVPRATGLSDGINLLSGLRITTRILKATLEDIDRPEWLEATVNGLPAEQPDWFRTDPRTLRHELNFHLPASVRPGVARVEVAMGRKRLGAWDVEVVE